jgi:hypothetical protein
VEWLDGRWMNECLEGQTENRPIFCQTAKCRICTIMGLYTTTGVYKSFPFVPARIGGY